MSLGLGVIDMHDLSTIRDHRDPDWYESSADRQKRLHPLYVMMDQERFTDFAFRLAGAVIGVAMEDHPHYVMPSQKITERVHTLMTEFGVQPAY